METIQVNGWVVFALVGGWVITTIIAIIGALPQLKRFRSQNALDDSNAATTYRKMALELQGQVDELRARLDHAHLEVNMKVQIGERPEIVSWNWKARVPEPVTQEVRS